VAFGLREDPTHADWLHLTEGEQIRWTGRPSRFTLVRSFAVAVILVVAGVALTFWTRPFVTNRGWPGLLGYVPLLLVLAGLVEATVTYLEWLRLLYVITDEEVYVKVGLVSRDVTQVPLDRVQNTSYEQSVPERILSYGDVYMFTAGTETEDVELRNVPNPERVTETLSTLLSERRREYRRVDEGV